MVAHAEPGTRRRRARTRAPSWACHHVSAGAPVVAVVDDDRSIRVALSSLLRSMDYEVRLFDGAQALLREDALSEIDCIITDVQMPGMNGLDMLEALAVRSLEIPAIVITAFPEPAVRQRAGRLGAKAFYSKPFDAADILKQVEEAVACR
jgi:FixJ family two-component response regulator